MTEIIRAWHGTNQEFASFDGAKLGRTALTGTALMAFFFSSDRGSAEAYAQLADRRAPPDEGEVDSRIADLYRRAGEMEERGYDDKAEELEQKARELDAMARSASDRGPRVVEAEIRAASPLRVPVHGASMSTERIASALREARSCGHDVVIFEGIEDADLGLLRDDHIAVLDPEVIRVLGSLPVDGPSPQA